MNKFIQFIEKIDQAISNGISKIMPTPKPAVAAPQVTPAPTEKSWFQKTFRSDERLKLEAYVMASTQAEQDAIVATMKDDMK